MTSKLTRERIEWLNYAATGLAANGTEMAMSPQDVIALTECCLAAMDSEPVAFIDKQWTLVYYVPPMNMGLQIGDKLYRHAQPAPVVPGEMTAEMMRAVQLNSELGAFVVANMSGAYDLFAEFWKVACRAAMLQAGNSPVIPEGYVMVPKEPTERMVIDGFESEPDETFSEPEVWEAFQKMSGCEQAAFRARLCWAAMLAAVPPAPTQENI